MTYRSVLSLKKDDHRWAPTKGPGGPGPGQGVGSSGEDVAVRRAKHYFQGLVGGGWRLEAKMLVIGERINATTKAVDAAIRQRHAALIRELAAGQVAAGATMLDVNAGVSQGDEPERMEWLVRTVQAVARVPLCLDSTNPEALERGLAAHRGRALVNSASGDEEAVTRILALAREHSAAVVCLIAGGGQPGPATERLATAASMVREAVACGLSPDDVYIDPGVLPASCEGKAVSETLQTINGVKASLGAKVVVGLSNVSFGLPNRQLLNRTFLAMAMAAGLDAAIMDPTDAQLMAAFLAAQALLGQDEYCLTYIKAHREGKLA
ncbi:MAG: dihydropteroate synthase [Chloroflexi bacterium]|nr:dihydropteroate synthase [Chloroflexota bacterium]